MNEPALHLTLGVKNPRTIDLWLWMAERRRTSDAANRDVPCIAAAVDRLSYSEELRSALLEGLDSDLVEQYLSETGSNLKPRPSFSLPWSATPELLPPDGDFLVRLTVQCHTIANGDSDEDPIELTCGGRRYRFPRSMRSIIERLDTRAPMPMGRLIEALAGALDEGMVRMLMGMLLKHGLIAIRV
jgi:hypothetical protein